MTENPATVDFHTVFDVLLKFAACMHKLVN
jgi:hypothetical protein